MNRDEIIANIRSALSERYHQEMCHVGSLVANPEAYAGDPLENIGIALREAERVREMISADHTELAKGIEIAMERLKREGR